MLWKASEKANQGQCFSKATGLNEKQRDKQKASKSSRKVSAGLLMQSGQFSLRKQRAQKADARSIRVHVHQYGQPAQGG
jgi:hypothetical protein